MSNEAFKDHIMATALQAKVSGKQLLLFGVRYNYAGIPRDPENTIPHGFIVLDSACFPYSTGDFAEKNWSGVEKFPTGTWTVMIQAIESCGILK